MNTDKITELFKQLNEELALCKEGENFEIVVATEIFTETGYWFGHGAKIKRINFSETTRTVHNIISE